MASQYSSAEKISFIAQSIPDLQGDGQGGTLDDAALGTSIAKGAASGAAAGSAIAPGYGTAIGAGIGGGLALIDGLISQDARRRARREAERRRLEAFRAAGKSLVSSLDQYEKGLRKQAKKLDKEISGGALLQAKEQQSKDYSTQLSVLYSSSSVQPQVDQLRANELRFDAILDGLFVASQLEQAKLGVSLSGVREEKTRLQSVIARGKGKLALANEDIIGAFE